MRIYSVVTALTLTVLTTLFSTACSRSSDKYTYDNYVNLELPSESHALEGLPVLSNDLLNWATDFLLLHDKYVVAIDKRSEHFLKLFSLESGQLIRSFGTKGQGPEEYIQASQLVLDRSQTDRFWVYDISTQKLKRYNLADLLLGSTSPNKIIRIESEPGITKCLEVMPDGTFCGLGFYSNCRIAFFNENGEFSHGHSRNPVKITQPENATQHSHGFEGDICYRPNDNHLIVAILFGSLLEDHSIEDRTLRVFIGPDSFFPSYEMVSVGEHLTITHSTESRIGYLDAEYCRKSGNLYLLYSGQYLQTKGKRLPVKPRSVLVMNKKGTISQFLHLTQGILKIAVSNEEDTLYGISSDRDNLLRFDLTKDLGIEG